MGEAASGLPGNGRPLSVPADGRPQARREPPVERWIAAATHLSALVVAAVVAVAVGRPVWWALLAAPVGPAAVAVAVRGRHRFTRHHASEAVRFGLSVAVYAVGVGVGFAVTSRYPALAALFPVLLLAVFLLVVNWGIFTVLASVRAAGGRNFEYPFAIRRKGRR